MYACVDADKIQINAYTFMCVWVSIYICTMRIERQTKAELTQLEATSTAKIEKNRNWIVNKVVEDTSGGTASRRKKCM